MLRKLLQNELILHPCCFWLQSVIVVSCAGGSRCCVTIDAPEDGCMPKSGRLRSNDGDYTSQD